MALQFLWLENRMRCHTKQHEVADKNPILAASICLWMSYVVIQVFLFLCRLFWKGETRATYKRDDTNMKQSGGFTETLALAPTEKKVTKKEHRDWHNKANQWSVSALTSLIKASLSYTETNTYLKGSKETFRLNLEIRSPCLYVKKYI